LAIFAGSSGRCHGQTGFAFVPSKLPKTLLVLQRHSHSASHVGSLRSLRQHLVPAHIGYLPLAIGYHWLRQSSAGYSAVATALSSLLAPKTSRQSPT
jgi:hypothetical protein